VFISMYEKDTLLRSTFGFAAFVGFLTGVLLYKLSAATHRRAVRITSLGLLGAAFIDVSTHTFIHRCTRGPRKAR